MIKYDVEFSSPDKLICDGLILGVYEDSEKPKEFQLLDMRLDGFLTSVLSEKNNYAEQGETTVIYVPSSLNCKRIIIVGLGKKQAITLDKIRICSANAVKALPRKTVKALAFQIPDIDELSISDITNAIVEGIVLGTYTFEYYKTRKDPILLEKIIINCPASKVSAKTQLVESIRQAAIVAECVNFTRDLVNHPSRYMTPTKMAEIAQTIANENRLECKILNIHDLQVEGMNLLLAVASGSSQEPKLITLKYTGLANSNNYIAFVGKGITFDSGGISLKPSAGMEEMKGDMAGAAAVLGAIKAIAELKLPVNVIGITPCTENMPDGSAVKPGDVVASYNGKTVEIVNTDAEGRLILADALSYAVKLGASKIIDLATLTGACVVALGTVVSGVISNNQEWCNQILKAGERCGEKMWQLPAYDEYKELIKSDIADIKNSGGRDGGAITAGLFLREFVGDIPWVHIDIAGTSDTSKSKGYNLKGATGIGVRTLITLVKDVL